MADVTLGQMKTEIADEIARTDLTSQIETAILDTLLIYGQQRFLFNSEVTETYTDEGVGYVPIPSGSFSIESIKVEESDTITRQLEYQSYRSLDRADNDPTYTNTPIKFCLFENKIRLYPVPDEQYWLYISYYKEYDLPTTDSETHVFFNNAKNLIKFGSKAYLYAHYLQDDGMALLMQQFADKELRRLTSVYNQNNGVLTLG